jgi:transposase
MSMTTTEVFEIHSQLVLEGLLAGLSEADAAANHGVSERTIQRWLQRGRDDPTGRYGEFATAVDRARLERELPPEDERPVDEDELLLLASRFGRKGNVRALELCRELLAERRSKAPSRFDELDGITEYVG